MRTAAVLLAALALVGCSQESPNVAACAVLDREIPEKSKTIQAAGSAGTQTFDDAGVAAKSLQDTAAAQAKKVDAPFDGQLTTLSDTYGRLRVSLASGDTDGLSAAISDLGPALEAVQATCQKAGE